MQFNDFPKNKIMYLIPEMYFYYSKTAFNKLTLKVPLVLFLKDEPLVLMRNLSLIFLEGRKKNRKRKKEKKGGREE